MNIDKTKLKTLWYQDMEGNMIDFGKRVPTEDELEAYPYCHTCYPLQLTEKVSVYDYDYSRLSPLKKFFIKIPIFKKFVQKTLHKGFIPIVEFNTTYNSGDDVIVAMVNSGDYTLKEAIMVYAKSCERCMNVLAHKYLNGTDGYEEYSEEWKSCNTICDFCRDM